METTNLELWDAGRCIGIINRQWMFTQLMQFCPPFGFQENIEANLTPENQILNSSEIVQAPTTFSHQPDQSCVIESIVEVPKENFKTEVKKEIKLEHQLDEEGNRNDYQTIVPSSSNVVRHHKIQIKKEKEDGILNDLSMVEAPNSNGMNSPSSSPSLGSEQSCVIKSIVEVPVKNEIKLEHHFGELSFDSKLDEFILGLDVDGGAEDNCLPVNNLHYNDCQPSTSHAGVKEMEDDLQIVYENVVNRAKLQTSSSNEASSGQLGIKPKSVQPPEQLDCMPEDLANYLKEEYDRMGINSMCSKEVATATGATNSGGPTVPTIDDDQEFFAFLRSIDLTVSSNGNQNTDGVPVQNNELAVVPVTDCAQRSDPTTAIGTANMKKFVFIYGKNEMEAKPPVVNYYSTMDPRVNGPRIPELQMSNEVGIVSGFSTTNSAVNQQRKENDHLEQSEITEKMEIGTNEQGAEETPVGSIPFDAMAHASTSNMIPVGFELNATAGRKSLSPNDKTKCQQLATQMEQCAIENDLSSITSNARPAVEHNGEVHANQVQMETLGTQKPETGQQMPQPNNLSNLEEMEIDVSSILRLIRTPAVVIPAVDQLNARARLAYTPSSSAKPKSSNTPNYRRMKRGTKKFPAPTLENSSEQPDPKKRRANSNPPSGTTSTTTGNLMDILGISQAQFQQFKEELKKTIESMRPCARQKLTVVGFNVKAQFVATSLKINAKLLPTNLIQILIRDKEFNFREIGIGHLLTGQPDRSRCSRSV